MIAAKVRGLLMGVVVLGGCGWFDDGHRCEAGKWSCQDDQVRVCTPDIGAMPGPKGPSTSWRIVQTCEDNSVSGPRTCAMLEERAQCVAESVDGGVAREDTESLEDWVRVDVGAGGKITGVQSQTLRGRPLAVASGRYAAVSYREERPIDAALVPAAQGSSEVSTVWVRGSAASSIAIVDVTGTKRSEHPLTPTTKGRSKGVAVTSQALGAELPPTLRVETASTTLERPSVYRGLGYRTASATPAALALVGTGLLKVPTLGVSALTSVAFVEGNDGDVFAMDSGAERPSAVELDAGLDASMPSVADAAADGGVLADGAASDGALPSDAIAYADYRAISGERLRAVRSGTTLWVDISAPRLEEYRSSRGAVAALEVELVRQAGLAFMELSSIAHTAILPYIPGQPIPEPLVVPADFPRPIADLVQARISPILERGESFRDAWSLLHNMGLTAGLAGPYWGAGWVQLPEEVAVDNGFASSLGGSAPEMDFAEYLARATIEGGWDEDGPCDEIRGRKLDSLAPRRLVAVAKLEVLRGLGVLTYERAAACLGPLETSSTSPALVLHKPNGESVPFVDALQSTRSDINGEVHVASTATRGDVSAVMDVMFHGAMPGVVRLKHTVNSRVDTFGATFALSNTKQHATLPTRGGLIVIDEVTREHIVCHVLMLEVAKPVPTLLELYLDPTVDDPWFGSTIFPLVTIRINKVAWVDPEALDVPDLPDFEGLDDEEG